MTLVVLIILAGITISLLLGDTEIFNKAQQSEDEYIDFKFDGNRMRIEQAKQHQTETPFDKK